jgi:hypothetical protein
MARDSKRVDAWDALTDALRVEPPCCDGDLRFTADKLDADERADMRLICEACPVFDLCRDYRRTNPPHLTGFWGGHLVGSGNRSSRNSNDER